jgi:hypothetical protein
VEGTRGQGVQATESRCRRGWGGHWPWHFARLAAGFFWLLLFFALVTQGLAQPLAMLVWVLVPILSSLWLGLEARAEL